MSKIGYKIEEDAAQPGWWRILILEDDQQIAWTKARSFPEAISVVIDDQRRRENEQNHIRNNGS